MMATTIMISTRVKPSGFDLIFIMFFNTCGAEKLFAQANVVRSKTAYRLFNSLPEMFAPRWSVAVPGDWIEA